MNALEIVTTLVVDFVQSRPLWQWLITGGYLTLAALAFRFVVSAILEEYREFIKEERAR